MLSDDLTAAEIETALSTLADLWAEMEPDVSRVGSDLSARQVRVAEKVLALKCYNFRES